MGKSATIGSFKQEKIIPLFDRVLVKLEPPTEYTPGGIFIKGGFNIDKATTRGRVVSVGQGHLVEKGELAGTRSPLQVKPGDFVALGKYAGSACVIDGVDHRLIPEVDVLAIIQEDSLTATEGCGC